jgi:hypothetical protein
MAFLEDYLQNNWLQSSILLTILAAHGICYCGDQQVMTMPFLEDYLQNNWLLSTVPLMILVLWLSQLQYD